MIQLTTVIQRGRAMVSGIVAVVMGGLRSGFVGFELLCVLGLHARPAGDLHRIGTCDAPKRMAGKQVIEDVEADVPARGAPRDEATVDAGPEREACPGARRLEL